MILALALGVGDALFLALRWRDHHISAPITYAGIDSLVVAVPVSRVGATLQNGKWSPALSDAQIPQEDIAGNERSITLVTLTGASAYGNFLQAIKNLKAQGRCNVAVRGSDEEGVPQHPLGEFPDSQFLSGLVLCGNSIGDAGFSGKLPLDRQVRLMKF